MKTDLTTVEKLTAELKQIAAERTDGSQHWLGIAGAPGSGKSTLADQLRQRLGRLAVVIPMDGYHFYREQLDALPDPVSAHARRGAPFTFDAARFVQDLQRAKQMRSGSFPAFDHGVGDPVEDARTLVPETKLVLVEGNYLLLNEEPWCQLRETVFDETWFLDVPLSICADRALQRHQRTGKSADEAIGRVRNNDLLNGQYVVTASRTRCDRRIRLPDELIVVSESNKPG